MAEYINVDLEVRSGTDLKPLADALSGTLFSLYIGREGRGFLATFENGAGVRGTATPDAAILRMVAAIDTLKPRIKRLWTAARDRVFDIGVAKAGGPEAFHLGLKTETVKAISRLNARMALSFYPPYYP